VRAEVAAAVASFVSDPRFKVAARCRELGISRKTFYKYVARFRASGVEGFYPDSRRPLTSPTRLPVELEDVLVAVRKEQAEAGWDYGADAVLMRLEERPELWPADRALPSRSTVNRIFDARGQLAKVPQRRPRRKPRRFARNRVNQLWQFDGFDYRLADSRRVVVLHLTDDCSRVDLALDAAVSENGDDIWATFCRAVARYGLPAEVLTDNGPAFSGRRRGWTSEFEANLAGLGVEAISSKVGHPQTCGKTSAPTSGSKSGWPAAHRHVTWPNSKPCSTPTGTPSTTAETGSWANSPHTSGSTSDRWPHRTGPANQPPTSPATRCPRPDTSASTDT